MDAPDDGGELEALPNNLARGTVLLIRNKLTPGVRGTGEREPTDASGSQSWACRSLRARRRLMAAVYQYHIRRP